MTDSTDNTDDLWGDAMAEQAQAEAVPAPPKEADVSPMESLRLSLIDDIPVDFSVEIGRTRMTIAQILKLSQGSVVELDVLVGEPLNVYVNQVIIAQGEVVNVNDRFGIRLTDILSPSERARRMSKKL